MSHKIQVTLSDRQFETLSERKIEQRASISELIRRAVEREYMSDESLADDLSKIEGGLGAWKRSRSFDPAREARKLRKPLGPRPERP